MIIFLANQLLPHAAGYLFKNHTSRDKNHTFKNHTLYRQKKESLMKWHRRNSFKMHLILLLIAIAHNKTLALPYSTH